MRRFYLLSLLSCMLVVAANTDVYSQNIRAMGPRLFINEPNGVAGLKNFTYSSSSTTGAWGHNLNSSWFNDTLVRTISDSLGCAQPSSANYTNKWVLIWRGSCQFGEKAKAAQDKGAKGVIIINNVPGADPVGMAAGTAGGGVTIPVLMVSNPDGAAIWSALGTQVVKLSLTRWGFGNTNDLALVPQSVVLGPGNIPLNSWKTGNTDAYKFYTGAYVANVGTATQNNIVLTSTVTFTPTGGTSSVVHTDTAFITSFNTIDSIRGAFSPRSANFNPSTTGKYTIRYAITSANTDQNPMDDTISYTFDVTANSFCKGRLTPNGDPFVGGFIRPGGTPGPQFVMGPLFHVASPNTHKMQAIKFAVNDGDTTRDALAGSAIAYVFKWTDGTGGSADKIIQPGELSLQATALKEFTSADSNDQIFTAYISTKDGTPGIVNTEPNTWYWIAVDVPAGFSLCTDDVHYFSRTNAAKYATTSVADFWAPLYPSSQGGMIQNTTDTVRMIPFSVSKTYSHLIDSADFVGTQGTAPAVAFEISPFTVSVQNEIVEKSQFDLYPNPAKGEVNIKLSLSKQSEKVQVRIIDAVGRSYQVIDRNNLQNETITVSTEKLPVGNYYAVVIANGTASTKAFTVIDK